VLLKQQQQQRPGWQEVRKCETSVKLLCPRQEGREQGIFLLLPQRRLDSDKRHQYAQQQHQQQRGQWVGDGAAV
jgi:hypothetical protein